jgi:hypothetical protein
VLRSSRGKYVPGRCRATNLCAYCRTLYTVETVEMLTLDALTGDRPTLYVVLTAREHLTRRDTYRHLEHLRRALRKRWPAAEWFVQVEFQRRGALHLNLAIKRIPVEQADAAGRLLIERWCARVDAEPVGQWAEAIEDAVAVTRYMGKMLAHGLKAEQAPPMGWKGHRTSHTRGYFAEGTVAARAAAQASLRDKRALYRARRSGLSGVEAELVAQADVMSKAGETYVLVGVIERIGGMVVSARDVSRGSSGAARRNLRWRGEDLVDIRTGEILQASGRRDRCTPVQATASAT